MSENARDTQFAGFAKLLFDDLSAICLQGLKANWNNIDIDRKQTEAIARRAYDLVTHAFERMNPIAPQYTLSAEEITQEIPDLTELPKEQES